MCGFTGQSPSSNLLKHKYNLELTLRLTTYLQIYVIEVMTKPKFKQLLVFLI